MSSHKHCLLTLLLWIVVISILIKMAISNELFDTDDEKTNKKTDTTTRTTTTTTTEKPLSKIFREIRKNLTTKDADLIIKMTRDFVQDMQQKMKIIKRVERSYSGSADFSTGSVFSDITRRFKHMCDLYKEFATVRRYVLGQKLNTSMAPSPDVVIVFQIMLSDYNEILMMIELFKIEMLSWQDPGADTEQSRDLIKKQMLKFGNLPSAVTPPQIIAQSTIIGNEKDKKDKNKKGRRWGYEGILDYPQKWSGELDGIGFDDR